MKIGSFEFNMRELAGSMGDMGTFFPLAVGYFAVCGVDPCGLLVMMGLANIVSGVVYKLPMPIEPMKVVAVVAIAQQWSPSMVSAAGIGIGVAWILITVTGLINWLARVTPGSVVRGIQSALGVMLAIQGARMIGGGGFEIILGLLSIIVVLTLRTNKYAPAAIVLVAGGMILMWYKGALTGLPPAEFRLPAFRVPAPAEIWATFLLAGIAQLPLTATNAVIATSDTITKLFPGRRVPVSHLALNHGVMNMVSPVFGGMPMCHGVGGLAGQYYYGARTGGTNIIEGCIEIALGLFLASGMLSIFTNFPLPIIGAMMFLVGLNLVKFARDIKWSYDLIPMAVTAGVSLIPKSNMAIGFACGMLVHFILVRAGLVRSQ